MPEIIRERLQEAIGYQFQQPELYLQALTHRSYGTPHNERLEFLGDSVLNCVMAAELFDLFGKLREGELSRLRANLVRRDTLHRIALKMSLGDCLRLGEGELRSGGHTRPSILADALEALLGAVFLEGGFAAARSMIKKLYVDELGRLDPKVPGKDPKTMLQETLQARRIGLPRYSVVSTRGVAHNQQFEVECVVEELSLRTTGSGSNRRNAEQDAAQRAFDQIGK